MLGCSIPCPVEYTDSIWDEICRRASGLQVRYANLPNRPLSTWSLVGRAAIRFSDLTFAQVNDRDHLYALWTKAMCSALNDLARRARREETLVSHAEEWADPTDPPHEALQELSLALQELARLDSPSGGRKAHVVVLRYLDGLSWVEISARLGVPMSTLRRDWYLARAWLRNELKRAGVRLP